MKSASYTQATWWTIANRVQGILYADNALNPGPTPVLHALRAWAMRHAPASVPTIAGHCDVMATYLSTRRTTYDSATIKEAINILSRRRDLGPQLPDMDVSTR